jgi:death-on-curing protein
MTDYLTLAEILAMHGDQIDRYGGGQGVRDQGLLEAALYRPQTGYYPDLIEEAAALWESLAQNHPFIDGNKRTAFAATYFCYYQWVPVQRRCREYLRFYSGTVCW